MQSPLMIGVASIMPGLGLLMLGQSRLAFSAFAAVVGLLGLAFIIPIQFIAQFCFQFAIFVWGLQIYYAVQLAQRSQKYESGQIKPPREFTPTAPPSTDLTQSERFAYQNREALKQQLLPGEHLREAIVALFMPANFYDVYAAYKIHQCYLGVTQKDLVLLELDIMGKPVELKRTPIYEIASVTLKKGRLRADDQVTLNFGGKNTLKLRVSRKLRNQTETIIEILQTEGNAKKPAG